MTDDDDDESDSSEKKMVKSVTSGNQQSISNSEDDSDEVLIFKHIYIGYLLRLSSLFVDYLTHVFDVEVNCSFMGFQSQRIS